MSGLKESGVAARRIVYRRPVALLLIVAAILFAISSLLQWNASMQRWVTFSNSLSPHDLSVEDHVYDYYLPHDEWVPIGSAAELLGVGLLLVALGFVLMAVAALLISDPTKDRLRAVTAVSLGFELLLVIITAGSFTLMGCHALVSGLHGTDSGLLDSGVLAQLLVYLGLAAPVILAVRWRKRLLAMSLACAFLLGSTIFGYFVSAYMIAPIISGMSHDTARWTETVIALSTCAAAIAAGFGAMRVLRQNKHSKQLEPGPS